MLLSDICESESAANLQKIFFVQYLLLKKTLYFS